MSVSGPQPEALHTGSEPPLDTPLAPSPAPVEGPSFLHWLGRNPVILKELRSRMRGRRAFLLLTVYLGLLSLIVITAYLIFRANSGPMGTTNDRQVFGKILFGIVTWLELLMVCFVAPALTAGAISSEREQQTFDLLRTTLLPARYLVLGKFFSALIYLLLLLLAGLPLQSLAFLFGGVAVEEVWIAALVLIITAAAFCAVGIFTSSFIRRTLASTVLAYAFAILLVFGLPMILATLAGVFGAIFSAPTGTLSPPGELLLLIGGWLLISINPLATVVATEVILLEEQSIWLLNIPLSSGSLYVPSPWLPYLIIYTLFSLLLLWLSVRFVRRPER